jgi:hypothetical protein
MLSNHPTYKHVNNYEDLGAHADSPLYGKLLMQDPAQPSRQQIMQPYQQHTHHSPTRLEQGSIHGTYKGAGAHYNENMNIINKNGGSMNMANSILKQPTLAKVNISFMGGQGDNSSSNTHLVGVTNSNVGHSSSPHGDAYKSSKRNNNPSTLEY